MSIYFFDFAPFYTADRCWIHQIYEQDVVIVEQTESEITTFYETLLFKRSFDFSNEKLQSQQSREWKKIRLLVSPRVTVGVSCMKTSSGRSRLIQHWRMKVRSLSTAFRLTSVCFPVFQPAVHVQGQEPLTASMLAAAPPQEQKQMLGG